MTLKGKYNMEEKKDIDDIFTNEDLEDIDDKEEYILFDEDIDKIEEFLSKEDEDWK